MVSTTVFEPETDLRATYGWLGGYNLERYIRGLESEKKTNRYRIHRYISQHVSYDKEKERERAKNEKRKSKSINQSNEPRQTRTDTQSPTVQDKSTNYMHTEPRWRG